MQSHRGSLVFTLPTFGLDFGSTQFDGADAAILEVNRADTGRIKLLDAVQTNRPVAAVDTSTIKLGELENGILCAIRGAIVLLEDRDYRYLRYGPFVFFLGYDRFAAAKTLETLGFPPLAGSRISMGSSSASGTC